MKLSLQEIFICNVCSLSITGREQTALYPSICLVICFLNISTGLKYLSISNILTFIHLFINSYTKHQPKIYHLLALEPPAGMQERGYKRGCKRELFPGACWGQWGPTQSIHTEQCVLDSQGPKATDFWVDRTLKTLESPLDFKEIRPVHPQGNQSWIFIGRTDPEAEAPILWPPDVKIQLTGKGPDAGKEWGQEEKQATEDEMAGWRHSLNGHECEQRLGDSEGQGNLAGGSPWGHKELMWLSGWTTWCNVNVVQTGKSILEISPVILHWLHPWTNIQLSPYEGRAAWDPFRRKWPRFSRDGNAEPWLQPWQQDEG